MSLQCSPEIAAARASMAKVIQTTQNSLWPSEYLVMHMCSALSDLSYNHAKSLFTEYGAKGHGAREPDYAILANLLFSYTLPLQGLLPHSLYTVHLPVQFLSPGTHVIAFALMGLEEPPTACGVPLSSMVSSSPPSTLWDCRKATTGGTPSLQGFLLRNNKTPHKRQAHPFKESSVFGFFFFFFAPFTAQPYDSKSFHTVLNLQDNQRSATHHRIQPLQYTLLLSLHHRP